MLTALCKVFGMERGPDAPLGHPRSIDLAGNRFSFAMPEDFSRDMPAEGLVEQLDITDLPSLDNPENNILIRRWWDIKEQGFFGKPLGTVMMAVRALKVPENRLQRVHSNTFNIKDRLDFILALDEVIRRRYGYDPETDNGEFSYNFPSIAAIVGDSFESEYRDCVYGGQKWTGYSVGGPHNQLIVGYALPVTVDAILDVEFTYSPNSGVLPRDFRVVAYNKMQLVLDSMYMSYAKGNEFERLVEGEWMRVKADEVIDSNKYMLAEPLFGREAAKELGLEK